MDKFVSSLSIIIIGLVIGYTLQVIVNKGWIKIPISIEKLTHGLQKIALLILSPIALIGALWMVNLDSRKLIFLPFLGVTAFALGGIIAFIFGKMQHLSRKQMGSYIVGGSFTNIGCIGGLVCFMFFGEVGYALVPLYKLFEELVYYGIGFPIAKAYSETTSSKETIGFRLKKIFGDIFILIALSSMGIGLVLNFSGIQRPEVYTGINAIVIPLATIILLTSIGINLKFNKMKEYIKPSLLIVISKIIIVPSIVTALAYFIDFSHIDNGLPLKVVLVLASMPTGFIAMVPPSIYDLDSDLANTTWVATNMSLLLTIPWLSFITNF